MILHLLDSIVAEIFSKGNGSKKQKEGSNSGAGSQPQNLNMKYWATVNSSEETLQAMQVPIII